MFRRLRSALPLWSFSSFCQNPKQPTQSNMSLSVKSRIPDLEESYEALLCTQLAHLTIRPQISPFRESNFGKLPFELRQMIYVHTLEPSHRIRGSNEPCTIKRKPGSHRFALLGVCRQIYLETRPIFFSKWTFYLEDAQHLYEFLIIIGRIREHLREIYVAPIVIARPSWRRESLELRLAGLGVLQKYEEQVKELLSPDLDPMILNANQLLRQCKKLKRIFFDVYKGSQHIYFDVFGGSCWLWIYHKKLIIQDLNHWCILENPDRGEFEPSHVPTEYFGFDVTKLRDQGGKPLKRLLVELKSSPDSMFKAGFEPDFKKILKTEIAEQVAERSRVFPDLEEP